MTVNWLSERLRLRVANWPGSFDSQGPPGNAVATCGGICMNEFSTLDRESFQKFLANAYAVQQSQVDSQSLSAIVEIQRLMAKGELGVDGTFHLIVERTQEVANASGVAIGLLKGDQLVYRAGSGSAATYTGRSVTARLVVPADSKANCEILRVENAETDERIEAAVCRQFGAKSLLILLICQDHAVAGVLEIFFSEPHPFQDGEVRTYRLMAGLVGDAMSRAARLKETKTAAVALPAPTLEATRPEVHHNTVGITPAWDTMFAQPPVPTMVVMRWARHALRYSGRRNVRLAAVAAVLALTSWIAYSHRRPTSSIGPLAGSSATSTVSGQASSPSANALPTKGTPTEAAPLRGEGAKVDGSAARRVRVSENEVDYIKDDVTVRYLTPKRAPHRDPVDRNEVANIGDDVTVRYFKRKPGLAPTLPIGGPVQPIGRSPSIPANSIPAKAAW